MRCSFRCRRSINSCAETTVGTAASSERLTNAKCQAVRMGSKCTHGATHVHVPPRNLWRNSCWKARIFEPIPASFGHGDGHPDPNAGTGVVRQSGRIFTTVVLVGHPIPVNTLFVPFLISDFATLNYFFTHRS